MYQTGYHTDDYSPAPSDENSVIDVVDTAAALEKAGTKFSSYGDENAVLSVGDRVEIAMNTHVLRGKCGNIVAETHGRWLVAVDGGTRMVVNTRDLKKVGV